MDGILTLCIVTVKTNNNADRGSLLADLAAFTERWCFVFYHYYLVS